MSKISEKSQKQQQQKYKYVQSFNKMCTNLLLRVRQIFQANKIHWTVNFPRLTWFSFEGDISIFCLKQNLKKKKKSNNKKFMLQSTGYNKGFPGKVYLKSSFGLGVLSHQRKRMPPLLRHCRNKVHELFHTLFHLVRDFVQLFCNVMIMFWNPDAWSVSAVSSLVVFESKNNKVSIWILCSTFLLLLFYYNIQHLSEKP